MAFKIDELFYELDARTTGFEDKITHSQQSLDNFAKFVTGKPVLAAAALGAALLGVAAAAVHMAEEVDVAMRQVEAAFPGAAKEMDRLRQTVSDLSKITPRTQAELAQAAARIAESGVKSVDEIQLRLRRAVEFADATGTDLARVVSGLDVVSDAFGISAKKAADELTIIYGAAQGKVGLDEVIATLEKGGSVLASLGVQAHDAGEAMVALIDAGVPRKQAGTVLETILELTSRVRQLKAAGGEQAEVGVIIERTLSRQNVAARGLVGALGDFSTAVKAGNHDLSEYGIRANTLNAIQRVVAATMGDTRTEAEKLRDAQDKLKRAADTNRESAGALAKILRNELSDSLIQLGNKLLPFTIKVIDGMTDAIRRLKGEGNPFKDLERLAGALPTVEALGQSSFRRSTRFESQAEKDAGKFRNALEATATRAERYGADAFSGIDPEQMRTIINNVLEYQKRFPNATTLGGKPINFNAVLTALTSALTTAREGSLGSGEGGAGDDPGPKLTALAKEVRDAITAMRRGVASTLAGETETRVDDARQRVAQFREEVAKLEAQSGRTLNDLRAEAARLDQNTLNVEAKERTEAAKKIAGEVAQAIGLQSTAMEQGLKDFLADVKRRNDEYAKLGLAPLFTPEQVEQVRAVRQALIDATKAAEATDRAITQSHALATPVGGGRGNLLAAMGALDDQLNALDAERTATPNDTPAGIEKRKRLLEQMNKVQAEMNGLRQQNDALLDKETAALQAHSKALQDQAAALQGAVGLALQLGQAFGLVSANTASTLSNIAGAATSVGPFLDALKTYRSGAADKNGNPLMTLTGLIGAAQPIIGGISAIASLAGLGGPSPEEQERRRIQRENTAAIRELSEHIGDLGKINVTGDMFSAVQDLLNKPGLLNIDSLQKILNPNQVIGDALREAGLSADDLREFAKQFGLTIGVTNGDRFTIQDLQQLQQAMKESELTTFGQTIGGQLQQLDAQINLFDITDPIEQFKLFRKAIDSIAGGGGILQRTLDAFDTTTATGLEDAQKALQDLFTQLQAGTLSAADLGGLTPQEFLDNLLKASDYLKQAQAANPQGTGGFNVDRTITEVTGSRLAAIADTSRIFLQQIAENTARLALAVTGGAALPAITPPATSGASAGGGTTITFGDILVTVPVSGAITPSQATDIGGQIATGIVDQFNRQLGGEVLWRQRAAGSIAAVS